MAELSTTLCWYCRNAVPTATDGCSWSRSFDPVDGWRAELRAINVEGKELISYRVHWCPEYKREGRQ